MRFLSSNDADWERRHPVTLLFFLCVHLYVLMESYSSIVMLLGLLVVLSLERRFPFFLMGLLGMFFFISYLPILIGWSVSIESVFRQMVRLAVFLCGMHWVGRFVKIERLLPLFSMFPRSSRLFYGGWALVPFYGQAIRKTLRSYPRKRWREAILTAVEAGQREPLLAVSRLRPFHQSDWAQLVCLLGIFGLSMYTPVCWLIYPYLTKGGVRDAMVIFRRDRRHRLDGSA